MVSNTQDTVTYELADVGSRLLAIIVDGIILSIIVGIFFGVSRQGMAGGFGSFLVGILYYWYFWTRNKGQTPGKMLMHIRVVKVDGTPMQDGDAVVRYIGYYINSIFFGLGWIWALFDANKQGWHDKLANTYVVRAQSEKPKNDFV